VTFLPAPQQTAAGLVLRAPTGSALDHARCDSASSMDASATYWPAFSRLELLCDATRCNAADPPLSRTRLLPPPGRAAPSRSNWACSLGGCVMLATPQPGVNIE